jgi:hypothetical protein
VKKLLNTSLPVHMAVFLFGFAGILGKMVSVSSLALTFGRVVFSSAAIGIFWRRDGNSQASKPQGIYTYHCCRSGAGPALDMLYAGCQSFHCRDRDSIRIDRASVHHFFGALVYREKLKPFLWQRLCLCWPASL